MADLSDIIKGAAADNLDSITKIQSEVLLRSHSWSMRGQGKATTLYLGTKQWKLIYDHVRANMPLVKIEHAEGKKLWNGLEVFIVDAENHLHIA